MRRVTMTCLMLLATFGPAAAATSADDKAGELDAGKKLFMQYCAKCHGERADGLGRLAAIYQKLYEPGPSDFRIGYFAYRPDDYLRKIIADGGEPHQRSRYMPPFKGELAPDQIERLVLLIKETGKRRSVLFH